MTNRNPLMILAIIIIALAIIVMGLLIISGGITFSNSPISQKSIVNDASIYASTNQTAVQQFIDNLDVSVDPRLQTTSTPKFTILTNLVLFDSNGIEYPKTIPTNVELAKNSLIDDQGRLLDLGSVQFTFDGVGTLQNKNLEISAMAFFCLDSDCVSKKLYRQGTLQNNKISLYVGDSFTEPPIGQRHFDYTFTFADEKLSSGTGHTFKVILKDIVFRNFSTDEKWLFVGEDEIYSLKLTVDGEKTVVYDDQLKSAISIFKKDNEFKSCADSGSSGIGFGSSSTSAVTISPVTLTVNDVYYDVIPSLSGIPQPIEANQYFLNNHISSGDYKYADICKSVLLPRNAKVVATIDGIDYKFFTPKSQANFIIECHNVAYGTGATVVQFGNERYVNFAEKTVCTSNIGYYK